MPRGDRRAIVFREADVAGGKGGSSEGTQQFTRAAKNGSSKSKVVEKPPPNERVEKRAKYRLDRRNFGLCENIPSVWFMVGGVGGCP